MPDYKGIQGTAVQNFSADPPAPVTGQVWYNSTTGQFKYQDTIPTGAWATGGNLNTGRYSGSGAGIQTSALFFGGTTDDGGTNTGATESYNGTAWTSSPNSLGTARRFCAGAGTQTAALNASGFTTVNVGNNESWNGTSWTEVGDVNTARRVLGGVGASNTAALVFGGFTTVVVNNTESWNGTSWTEVNDLNTTRSYPGGAGTQTAALAFGGATPTITGATESWNGTSWTNSPASMNTARGDLQGCGATNTAALAFGGATATVIVSNTESYNGTSWTEVNDLNFTSRYGTGIGTNTAALNVSGAGSIPKTTTEEWNAPYSATEIITTT